MLVDKSIVSEMQANPSNLVNQFAWMVADNNLGSLQFGRMLGLFALSDALNKKICIPMPWDNLTPSIRAFIIGDKWSYHGITEAVDVCLSIMAGRDKIVSTEWEATTSYLKLNDDENSIVIHDFEERCPKKSVGYIDYLRKNFSNSLCYVSSNGLSDMLKNNTPGIVSLFNSSLCMNAGDYRPTISSHITPSAFSMLKNTFWDRINHLEKFSRIEFSFTSESCEEIERVLKCTQKMYEGDKRKYGLYDGFSHQVPWIAILTYVGSSEFYRLIEDADSVNETLQITVPDSYVQLALAEICTYHKKESQKYLKYVYGRCG